MAGNKSKQVSRLANNSNNGGITNGNIQQSSSSSSSTTSTSSSSSLSSSSSSNSSTPPLPPGFTSTLATTTTTTSSSSSSSSATATIPMDCYNCHKPIRERFLLKALDQYWHEDCLKCSCCDCRLGEVGSTLFTKANLILCKRDYLRLFGNTGFCSACNKTIPGFEMVMRAKSNVYHLECFSCFQCHQKFCVGDRFYLYENKILCEYDYEERMVFANLSRHHHHHQNNNPNMDLMRTIHNNNLNQHNLHHPNPVPLTNHHQQQQQPHLPPHAHLNHHQQQQQQSLLNKDQGELCDASSGYGSGDSPFDH